MEEAIIKADSANSVIAPNKRLSQFIGSDDYHNLGSLRAVLPCWTGTMVGYDEPGKPLGETIEYTDPKSGIRYVFPVPQEHRGKCDLALVVEHPDFTLEADGNNRVVDAKEIGVVPDLPGLVRMSYQHQYLGDPKYDIPSGKEVRFSEKGARILFRLPKRVGLIARADNYFHGPFNVPEYHHIGLSVLPSVKLGLPVEAPAPQARAGASSSFY